MTNTPTVPAVEKALTILQHMSDSKKTYWGVTELAKELNLNKSTVYSILNTMIPFGFIEKNQMTERYALGYGLFNIIGKYYEHNPIRSAFEVVVEPMHHKLPECINCFILRNDLAYILCSFPSSNYALRVEMPEGTFIPPIFSSAGKILLCGLSNENIRRIYDYCREEPAAKDAPPYDDFLSQIQLIREQQYAFNLSEYENGICSVASPIKNHLNQIVAAVNIVAPESRFLKNKEIYVHNIKEIAKKISGQLGCKTYSEY